MKNLRWVFFFGALLVLLLPFQSQAQEVLETAAKTGLFAQIGDWVKGNVLALGVGVGFGLIPLTIRLSIKAIARKGAVFFTELSHFAGDTATLCNVVDQAIKEDGSLPDKNSIQDVLAAGKEVVIEMKDMKAVFTPKV